MNFLNWVHRNYNKEWIVDEKCVKKKKLNILIL